MEAQVRLGLKITGSVIVDATYKNQVLQGFVNYMYQALQGQAPLISYYQIYEANSGVTVKAQVLPARPAKDGFDVIIVGVFQQQIGPLCDFVLQAVLTDGTVVDISTAKVNLSSAKVNVQVTWILNVAVTITSTPGLVFDNAGIYYLLESFFTNTGVLHQSAPYADVYPQPYYMSFKDLELVIIYNNYQFGTECPTITMALEVLILGIIVLDLAYTFGCTPNPWVFNMFVFSVSISP